MMHRYKLLHSCYVKPVLFYVGKVFIQALSSFLKFQNTKQTLVQIRFNEDSVYYGDLGQFVILVSFY